MLRVGHHYPEDINAHLRKHLQQSTMYHVHWYDQENLEFEVQEILSPHHDLQPMSYRIRLND